MLGTCNLPNEDFLFLKRKQIFHSFFGFFSYKFYFIYFLFLAALGLSCCMRAFSSYSKQGLLFVVVRGLHIAVASLCCGAWALGEWASVLVALRLHSCALRALERRLSNCGSWALLLHGMWDLPGPGLEPVPPVLSGRFLTTVPPGKSFHSFFNKYVILPLHAKHCTRQWRNNNEKKGLASFIVFIISTISPTES